MIPAHNRGSKEQLDNPRRIVMWQVTMGVGTLLLIIVATGLAGAVGMIILIAVSVNR